MTADRRAALDALLATDAELVMDIDTTAVKRRAALVFKIQSLLIRTCNVPKCKSDHLKDATAAVSLIRAETLEEAAVVCAYHWTPKECADAIRALKEKPNDK